MKELVVLSGKGGTGKTSIVASFAALARACVLADCDVDAADLHLVLKPNTLKREPFSGGKRARIGHTLCIACGTCAELCRWDAILPDGPGNGRVSQTYRVEPTLCEGCGVCARFCMEKAIELTPEIQGEWFISDTRFGPLVHAQLGVAESNSGKLVSILRQLARRIAQQRELELLIVDGSPGIGCPVIASLTGANLVLIVTEPTVSGLHDLDRLAELAGHFGTPAVVCINKWDLNAEMSAEIRTRADRYGFPTAGQIRYDRAVTEAQIQEESIVEHSAAGCAGDVRSLWAEVLRRLQSPDSGFASRPGW